MVDEPIEHGTGLTGFRRYTWWTLAGAVMSVLVLFTGDWLLGGGVPAWARGDRAGHPACPAGRAAPGVGRRGERLRAEEHGGHPARGDRPRRLGRRYVDPEIAASALTEDACPLTERELEMLRASRAGASVNEIAARVHLAPGTVRNYLSAAMTKLDVSSRHAAAHRAWEEGWI
ncbi:helix-turn-helix transcriptional regulator [Micromonospora rubida]|uniref:helix-turn-helix transcriptional regulator n=1 Tax=Micromonospora rubida TaxID=2697657 RepID=UPI00191C44FA|nr:LuxR C-terminal-related transcriptional regulator [Micromonospora rubida]